MADTIGQKDPPQALFESPTPTLDIGDTGPAEARGLAALLAQAQGWKAILCLDGTLSSPHGPSSANQTSPSRLEALRFLDRFRLDRDFADQSQATLAAVLLMPS
jgi:hypothetical protein